MSKANNPNLGGYVPFEEQNIINVEINKEMRKSFLDYSMSVITKSLLWPMPTLTVSISEHFFSHSSSDI